MLMYVLHYTSAIIILSPLSVEVWLGGVMSGDQPPRVIRRNV